MVEMSCGSLTKKSRVLGGYYTTTIIHVECRSLNTKNRVLGGYYTATIIRNPQNSIGKYLGSYSMLMVCVTAGGTERSAQATRLRALVT